MPSVSYLVGILFVVLSGITMALQSGVNASLGRAASSRGFAAVFSFITGLLMCVIFMLAEAAILHKPLTQTEQLKGVPWWAWLGGLLGAFYVIVVIVFVQQLGAGTLVAIFMCSQLISSMCLDLLGLAGFPQRTFSWQRLLGAALLIAGTLLVTFYPGQIKMQEPPPGAAEQGLQKANLPSGESPTARGPFASPPP